MMDAAIQTKGLSKWFGEAVALNNVDLEIAHGVTGLLGPNGAGKSTFIKLALGIYSPSRGTIRVLGKKPRNNMALLSRIGYCPESDCFYENMTGFEFLYWMNRFWGMSARKAERAAERACASVHMDKRMDDPISEYSRGMRQRIKIAQALSTSPELLFLDEPMAGLDPEGRREMFELIRTLGREGRTVIVSSHVLYEVERVTNTVVLLHNGCVLAHGPVDHIRQLITDQPRTVSVDCPDPRTAAAEFIADPGTLSIAFQDGSFTIRTDDVEQFYDKLNRFAAEHRVQVDGIRCVDEDLQSVFDYLVK